MQTSDHATSTFPSDKEYVYSNRTIKIPTVFFEEAEHTIPQKPFGNASPYVCWSVMVPSGEIYS